MSEDKKPNLGKNDFTMNLSESKSDLPKSTGFSMDFSKNDKAESNDTIIQDSEVGDNKIPDSHSYYLGAEPRAKNILNDKTRQFFSSFWKRFKTLYVFRHPLFTVFMVFFSLFFFLSGIVFGSVLAYVRTSPQISADQLEIKSLISYVYDDQGNQIAELKPTDNKNRTLVTYDQINDNVKKAVVDIEDERFWTHNGIDLKRTSGAFLGFITGGGSSAYGGSTITQQVIKNLTGDARQSVKRKVQEMWRAMELEKEVSKEDILQCYLNLVFFGNNYYGIESASMGYFGKHASQLTLAESAAIAGILNAPSLYNPYRATGLTRTIDRQHVILDKMLELGSITQEEHDAALAEKLNWIPKKTTAQGDVVTQSYFVDQVVKDVRNDLMTRRGISEESAINLIYNYGLKIYTTESSAVQGSMDKVFQNDKTYIPSMGKAEHPQAGMVITDPANGNVKAMYGGYGVKQGSTLNRATSINRQAGSSFKPLAVYGPALDKGIITPSTIYVDDVMYEKGRSAGPYPVNGDGTYSGAMTIRKAVTISKNTIAVKVFKDLGAQTSIDYLKKVGIDRSDNPEEATISLALGGLIKGVSPLDMSSAYDTFDNGGIYYTPTTYTKVVNEQGQVMLENVPSSDRFISETAAAQMTSMMQDVVRPGGGGTASAMGLLNGGSISIAGKTGTTNSNVDSWFVGFTPYYVGAVWYGYDNSIKKITISAGETARARIIWKAVMDDVHKNLPPKTFPSITNTNKAN